MQRRLLTLQRGPEAGPYLAVCRAEITGPLDLEQCDRTLAAAVRDVTSLRATIDRLGPDRHLLELVAPAMHADAVTLRDLTHGLLTRLAGGEPAGARARYADAVAWWNHMTRLPGAAAVREFWRAESAGWTTRSPSPGETPAKGPFQPGTTSAVLRGPLLRALRDRPEGLRHWLLAAWSLAARPFAPAGDLVVGVGTDLRRHEELRDCSGPLTPYLPLRVAFRERGTLAELAAALAERAAKGTARAEWFTWESCVSPGPDQEEWGLPLGFDHLELPAWSLGRLQAKVIRLDCRSDRYRLRLAVRDLGDAVELHVEHDKGVPEVTAGFLPESLLSVLADAMARPAEPVTGLTLVGDRQLELLEAWSGANTERPEDPAQPEELCPSAMVGRQIATRPDAVAVVCGAERLTYRELGERVDRLSGHLAALGVGPEIPVAILLPPSTELVISMLAVAAAGGAYLPLDPDHPAAWVHEVYAEARPLVVVTVRSLASRFPPGPRTVLMDTPCPPAPRPRGAATPDNLLYILYTSGSTGRPKGVMVTRANVARLLSVTAAPFAFGPDDVWTLFHSASFDISAWELWGALASGGRLVVLSREQARSPQAVCEIVEAERVTVLNQVPTSFRALRDPLAARLPRFGALRAVVFGGEALHLADVAAWLDRADAPELVNMYGITETTVHATHHRVHPADADRSVIGRPLADLRIWLLDQELNPVPIGATGEIYVSGPGVTRGYLGQPGRTAERFVPGPPRLGGRLYRSGDKARWSPGGVLEYLGRIDDQVKIRGFRIEPGAVEACLARHPGVRQCAVVAVGGAAGRRLAAYLVTKEPADRLRRFAEEGLPAHMVPSLFIQLDSLPMTVGGKVDRAALPSPEEYRPALSEGYAAPTSEVERTLCEVWTRVLKVERVGVHDNYFALGGDSILSILVAAQAAARGLRVELQHFFEHQTVAEMATVVRRTEARVQRPAPPEDGGLTPIQHWFFGLGLERPGQWNQSRLFAPREVDVAALRAAVRTVTGHHRALRTRFVREGSGPGGLRAVDGVPAGETFQRVDLAARADWPRALEETLAGLREADVGRGPLFRCALIDGGSPDRVRLALIAHHLVVDHVSWQIILDDLRSAYLRHAAGEPVTLPATTCGPEGWSALLASRAATATGDLPYWRAQTPLAPPVPPLDHPVSGPVLEADRRAVESVLDRERTRVLLREMPGRAKIHIDDVLVTALARAICEWTGQPRAHLDIEGQGRTGDLIDEVNPYRSVGWFTSIAPLLLDLPARGGPADALAAVKRQLHAFHHRALGYGVLRHLDDEHAAELAARPAPQVVFNFIGRDADEDEETGPLFGAAPEEPGQDHHPANHWPHLLDVLMTVRGGRLVARIHHGMRHHEAATVERLAGRIRHHLEELVDTCGSSPLPPAQADFPLLRTDPAAFEALIARAAAAAPGKTDAND